MHVKTDVGSRIKGFQANAQATAAGVAVVLTAGATEDGVKVTGTTLDRATPGGVRYDSTALEVSGLATLAQDETLSFAVEYQDSADGSTWNTAVALQASTVAATGGTGGSNETVMVELDLDMSDLERYVRFNVTPAMSAASADTAVWSACAVFGGADILPV